MKAPKGKSELFTGSITPEQIPGALGMSGTDYLQPTVPELTTVERGMRSP